MIKAIFYMDVPFLRGFKLATIIWREIKWSFYYLLDNCFIDTFSYGFKLIMVATFI